MEKEPSSLPAPTRARLPQYFRAARELLMGEVYRSSAARIAALAGLPTAQVRSDLRLLGAGGQKGYGFNVKQFYTVVSTALGAGEGYRAIYLGQTALAQTLADPALFLSRGIVLEAVFAREGEQIGILPLSSLEDYLKTAEEKPAIAVLGPGFRGAEETARLLAASGVAGIWNLSETTLRDIGCAVENFNPGDSLMRLSCAIRSKKEEK